MLQYSIIVSIHCSDGIVCSSYRMVSTLKCVMRYESEKGPLWGLKLCYQFGTVVMNIVGVCGLFLAISFD
jgi:hypothetical protein